MCSYVAARLLAVSFWHLALLIIFLAMLVGLTADSHGGLKLLARLLQDLQAQGVKHLLHAGDFLVEGVVEVFAQFPEIQIWLARGNCDVNEELWEAVTGLPQVRGGELLSFELAGKSLALAHKADLARSELAAEIYVFGHTHVPCCKRVKAKLFLNPGSLFEGQSYFLLDLESGQLRQKFLAARS